MAEPEIFSSQSHVEHIHTWYIYEAPNHFNSKPVHLTHRDGRLSGPNGVRKISSPAVDQYVSNIMAGREFLQSKQVITIRNSQFGDVKIVPERDGFNELVTDHRKYQPPEAFAGILETIYLTGASGSRYSAEENSPIGIHVSVASRREEVPKLLRAWRPFRAPLVKWANPAGERHRYNRQIPTSAFSLLDQGLSDGRYIEQFVALSHNNREREFNVYELAENKKEVAEVRLFNTETPAQLTDAIRLSLGLAQWSE